jgi:hypothetical protein
MTAVSWSRVYDRVLTESRFQWNPGMLDRPLGSTIDAGTDFILRDRVPTHLPDAARAGPFSPARVEALFRASFPSVSSRWAGPSEAHGYSRCSPAVNQFFGFHCSKNALMLS